MPADSRPVLVAPRHVRKLVADARESFTRQLGTVPAEELPLELDTAPILAAFNNAISELVAELELVLEESERRRLDLRGADSVIAVLLQRTGGEARISAREIEDVIPGATLVSEPYDELGGGLVFRYVAPSKS